MHERAAAPRPAEAPIRAVFLDALGTMVALEPPWVHLAAVMGVPEDERLVRAVRTEMAYYKAHSHEGTDEESLADLRARCAGLLSRELGHDVSVAQMMASIRFRPYPDTGPALRRLRDRGLRLVCVSNWDCSLPAVLERCGLGGALDGVVTSAGSGARKPDPAIFAAALLVAGCRPGEALHVGDTRDEDVAGAEAAGVAALLIDREGRNGQISSLAEVEAQLLARRRPAGSA